MKFNFFSLIAIASFIGLSAIPASAAGIAKRQANQDRRIENGASSGNLTQREQKIVDRKQARIEEKRVAASSDGNVTRREKANIKYRQQNASDQIHDLKHNDIKSSSPAY